jgi:hypothetical protein
MRKYADIGFPITGHSAPLRLAYRFAGKKLLNLENQVDPFYTAKSDISKIVVFKGEILNI